MADKEDELRKFIGSMLRNPNEIRRAEALQKDPQYLAIIHLLGKLKKPNEFVKLLQEVCALHDFDPVPNPEKYNLPDLTDVLENTIVNGVLLQHLENLQKRKPGNPGKHPLLRQSAKLALFIDACKQKRKECGKPFKSDAEAIKHYQIILEGCDPKLRQQFPIKLGSTNSMSTSLPRGRKILKENNLGNPEDPIRQKLFEMIFFGFKRDQ